MTNQQAPPFNPFLTESQAPPPQQGMTPPPETTIVPPMTPLKPPENRVRINPRVALGLVVVLFLLGGIGSGTLLIQQNQDIRRRAQEIKCNSICDADIECQDANPEYICFGATGERRGVCRHKNNLEDKNCSVY